VLAGRRWDTRPAGGGYGQYFCPITRASEIFAVRWMPIIVRNLLLGAATFSDIQAGALGLPRSLLTERLRQLEQFGVVVRRPKPKGRGWLYELTELGRDLAPVCEALGTWGARWLEAVPTEVDPAVVVWAICKCMDRDRLPEERVVVRVSLRDHPEERFWLFVQRPEPEVCRKPPGFDEDLVVTSDTEWLAKWHMGRLSLGQAMHARVITVEGPQRLVREFSKWAGIGQFAAITRAHA
jgi:DNA-binding HxlR family transcriptional regulator